MNFKTVIIVAIYLLYCIYLNLFIDVEHGTSQTIDLSLLQARKRILTRWSILLTAT